MRRSWYFLRKDINTSIDKYYHDIVYHYWTEEVSHEHHNEVSLPRTHLLFMGGSAINMAAITYALIGFVAGLFTMTMISLYKYVFKLLNR
ncbi:MAG: hypothetical protein JW840_07495 [Candidatus Thermoplasmatota archaeon]|nr:hypothetical protein [Candidatus Thermoplasmatota archaeon]